MAKREPGERHLRTLREILERDYLARPDERFAREDLARMAREALHADEVMVARWEEAIGWEAVTSSGDWLRDEEISRLGSRSLLEAVRTDGKEILRTSDVTFDLASKSIQEHAIASYLCVPLHLWSTGGSAPARVLDGCLYAHRGARAPLFDPTDVALARDIARLAQPTLNVLRHLADARGELQAQSEEVARLRQIAGRAHDLGTFRTRSPALSDVVAPLRKLCRNPRVTLLIVGPSGSGKSHLALAYHNSCPRRDRPFVVMDCGSVTSAETLGAELFGYAPRSGYANAPREGAPGKARLAHGGTLFVDEVANLSLELQPRLLRLIQDGRYSPLGASREEQVDLQVIAATNADLEARVRAGTFREDLYHRLNVVRVALPPLSSRTEDVADIAKDLLARICAEGERPAVALSRDALQALSAHDWEADGNVRGLENLLRRSLWTAPDGARVLDAAALRFGAGVSRAPESRRATDRADTVSTTPASRRKHRRDTELDEVVAAIRQHGSAKAAAKALGRSYRQVYWVLVNAGLRVQDVLDARR